MPDRLFLSCWLRSRGNGHGPDLETRLRQFAKMLSLFPLSRLAARGPELRTYVIERTEPPQFEREFPHAEDPAETVEDVMGAAYAPGDGGRATGVHNTSSIRAAPVASITSRSKPRAAPLAGGICARAARKSSSIG